MMTVADQPGSSRARGDRPLWIGVDPSQGHTPRAPLTRPHVVRTALRLVDEHGLDTLTMRSLATELQMDWSKGDTAAAYFALRAEACTACSIAALSAAPISDSGARRRVHATGVGAPRSESTVTTASPMPSDVSAEAKS